MKLQINRTAWTRFELPEPAWVDVVSVDSKDVRVFWLMAGTWAGREVWDIVQSVWRFELIRKQPQPDPVMVPMQP